MASEDFRAATTRRHRFPRSIDSHDSHADQRSSHERTKPVGKHFDGLDVVRTILALTVALGHFFYLNGRDGSIPHSFILAVDFFFALSGFVLTQSVLTSSNRDLSGFVQHFAVRRIFRLMPLYLLALVATAIVQCLQYGSSTDPFYYFLVGALLLQDIGFAKGAMHIFLGDTSMGVAWSISVEMWVGLAFFCMVFVLRTSRTQLACCCLAIAVACAATLVNDSPNFLDVHYQQVNSILTFGALRCALGLSLGCLAYITYAATKHVAFGTGLCSVLEVALVVGCFLLYGKMSYVRQNEFIAPLIFAVVIYVFSRQSGVISRFLSARVFSPARPLSYAIYLIHPLSVVAFRYYGLAFDWRHAFFYIASLLALSFALNRTIEQPGIRLGQRLLPSPRGS